jgi:8-oxo-dGTP diphosphatase
MSYTYTYPRPAVTVDCLIFSRSGQTTWLLLIQRDKPPFEGSWALPGGFVDIDEPLETAAHRELEEETAIRDIRLQQFYTFGKPGRDPRGRTISVVYYGFMNHNSQQATAGSDARNARWFDILHLPELAFDHHDIIHLAIKKMEL